MGGGGDFNNRLAQEQKAAVFPTVFWNFLWGGIRL